MDTTNIVYFIPYYFFLLANNNSSSSTTQSLLVLEHLIKHGPEQCLRLAENDLLPRLIDLQENFKYTHEDKDHGINVRVRAEQIAQLLQSPSALKKAREAARQQQNRFQGYSKEDMVAGKAGGGGTPAGGQSYSAYMAKVWWCAMCAVVMS